MCYFFFPSGVYDCCMRHFGRSLSLFPLITSFPSSNITNFRFSTTTNKKIHLRLEINQIIFSLAELTDRLLVDARRDPANHPTALVSRRTGEMSFPPSPIYATEQNFLDNPSYRYRYIFS
jgi:hypothetical protein